MIELIPGSKYLTNAVDSIDSAVAASNTSDSLPSVNAIRMIGFREIFIENYLAQFFLIQIPISTPKVD